MERGRKRVHELHQEVAPKQADFDRKPKKNWVLPAIAISAVLLLIITFIRLFTPETQPPLQENSWNGVTPGYSFTQKVSEELGEPISVNMVGNAKEVSYKSVFPSKPNTILVSDNGIVEFIKEHVTYDSKHTVENYLPKLGQPDFVLFAPEISIGVQAHVFLSKGVVLIAHSKDNSVEQKWYFAPTNKDSFMFTWGKELSESFSNPE